MQKPRGRVAFLLSGSGSTLTNLLAEIEAGHVPGEVVVVLSDRDGVKGMQIAREHGIPVCLLSRREHKGRAAYGQALGEALRPYAPDLVVNGGFLTLYDIPPTLAGRILNVHPALLPSFGGKGCYGSHVHRMVLESGCRVSGCSVHFVTEEVDAGPIVGQLAVPVAWDDTVETLGARVQEAERRLYPECIRDVLSGALVLRDGRVVRATE